MLEELLGALLPPEHAQALLDAADRDRDFARQALDQRKAGLARLGEQLTQGVWHSGEVAAAVDSAGKDRLLLRMSCQKFIDAHDGLCDLDIEYHPLLPHGRSVSLDDITAALGFIAKARLSDPPELWFGALQDEASAYLHQLRGDHYLAQAIRPADVLDAELMERVDRADPYAERSILGHAAAVALFRRLQLPWRVVAAYRRFMAAFAPGDPFEGWRARAEADSAYRAATLNPLYGLVLDALDALCLAHPSDRSEIERLEAEQPPPDFAPAIGMFEQDPIELPPLPAAEFAAAAAALAGLSKALKPAAQSPTACRTARAAAVLAGWEAFARRGVRDFVGLARRLAGLKPDGEALGIVTRALRGEAYYRMGRFEDAYLDLLAAEDGARAALGRRGDAAADATGWTATERDAVSRFAQKAGNALASIGDEEQAGEAYLRAEALAAGPLAVAGARVNEGNRQFLRNSVVGGQGYITLDVEARQAFVLRGPERLKAAVGGRHVESLSLAEAAYRGALDALAGLDPAVPGARNLAATCHVDLGNVGWAWGQTMVAECAARLRALPGIDGFDSQLLALDSGPRRCYEAALAEYGAALALLDAEQAGGPPVPDEALPLVLTALSSSSEMRYLVARERVRGEGAAGDELPPLPAALPEPDLAARAGLATGLDEANRCLALIHEGDAVLYPDLVWRTHYNLARMYRLLGRPADAAEHFRQAIDAVEALRGSLRLDSFQAAFLHDKHDVYEGYIDLLLAQDAAGNMPRIFELFERSRARAFLSLLQATQTKTGLPKALRAQAEDLLARVSDCNERIQAAVAADQQAEAQELLAEQRKLGRLWNDMQAKIAQSQQAGGQAPPVVGLAEFQAALAEDQAFFGILPGDEASYAVLIDRAAARAFRLPPRRTLELLALPVLAYATWSNSETAAQFRAANVELCAALFGPIDAAVGLKAYLQGKHLLISPDGILCYLPFDLLLADTAGLARDFPGPADYPDFVPYYLLNLADLSYAPSASAWTELGRRKREASRAGMMAVYNVLYDMPEPPLWAISQQLMLKLGAVTSGPDMKRLTDAVRKAWGEDVEIVRLRSRTDDGADEETKFQSTEKNFLALAPESRARILMFHGHGIYNDRYPGLSGLIFNLQVAADQAQRARIPTAEDGFLRVEELFQLDMPGVELTLLAACQTALGAYRRGEGLNALVQAFLHRGSPAVMATLWEVRADVTAFLLKVFFRLLSEQPDADRARLFCQAKRKVMPIPSNLYLPYFWAPFVLWGYTRPLDV